MTAFPPLLRTWPRAVQLLLVGGAPLAFGLVCGGVLAASGPVFLALQAGAIAGGFWAGLEHTTPLAGATRGALCGLLFGAGILGGHELVGGADHSMIPDVRSLQLAITSADGGLLGIAGARARQRRTGGRATATAA
jgi:hypothetical protein